MAPACTLALGDFEPASTSTTGGIGGAGGTPATAGTGGAPTTSSNGGAMATTGAGNATAGTGGVSAITASAAAGTGGDSSTSSTGGEPCNPACVMSTNPCVFNACVMGKCAPMNLAQGTNCDGLQGKCDGMGACVGLSPTSSAASSSSASSSSSSTSTGSNTGSSSGSGSTTGASSSSTGVSVGSGGASSSASGSSGSGIIMIVDCQTAADCGINPPCYSPYTCTMNTCEHSALQFGTPAGMNIPHDCDKVVCNGNGGTMTVPDNMDAPIDGDVCNMPMCANGTAVYGHPGPGTMCAPAKACSATGSCLSMACLLDGFQDGLETGPDCGGPACGACTGSPCNNRKDCASAVCIGNVCQ